MNFVPWSFFFYFLILPLGSFGKEEKEKNRISEAAGFKYMCP